MLRSARWVPLCAVFAIALGGCDRPPSAADLPEWSPADHDHAPGSGAAPRGSAAKRSPAEEADDVAEIVWSAQCQKCHGPGGRGDGPNAVAVKPPDLTSKELQSRRSDAEMMASIRAGKGQMPRFDLSEPVLAALVRRIRARRAP